IYCDFSGYSDIARGSARVMGFKLMLNFDRPYFAESIADFWRRWHISLSTWFRDYIYFPLGGSRVNKGKVYRNLSLVFMISGLWHGASWTFIIWGALHAVAQITGLWSAKIQFVIGNFFRKFLACEVIKVVNIFVTFFIVTFIWIFFRSEDVTQALKVLHNMFTGLSLVHPGISLGSFKTFDILLSFMLILCMELIHVAQSYVNINEYISGRPTVVRWLIYYSAILLVLFMGKYSQQEFIYFQF
ncbi:MAG: MBOAT family protein, partial [Bacteroidia bacterium]|nr:MBOAT family protein [Bacteroidia bacterium]